MDNMFQQLPFYHNVKRNQGFKGKKAGELTIYRKRVKIINEHAEAFFSIEFEYK